MISILLPTFNQATFLPDALAGLAAQTYRDFEVIACDDGSTDATPDILKAAGIQTLTHELNCGTATAINLAAEAAMGEYMTWVSSDNVMDPNWLEKLVGLLEVCGGQAVYSAYCRLDLFPDTVKPRPRLVSPGHYERCRLISSLECYFGPSFLVKRQAWLEHREGLAHDYDWWLRFEEAYGIGEHGPGISYYPEPLCDYRMGPWQTGRNRPKELIEDAKRRQAEAMERRCKTPVVNAAI